MTTAMQKNRLRPFLPQHWGELDVLFDQMLGPGKTLLARTTQAASLWEDDESIHLEIDAPGVTREDINLTFDKGTLEVRINRKRPDGDRPVLLDERVYGELVRTVSLPETVNPESVEASLTDGVLKVTLAKFPEAQPKRIEIK